MQLRGSSITLVPGHRSHSFTKTQQLTRVRTIEDTSFLVPLPRQNPLIKNTQNKILCKLLMTNMLKALYFCVKQLPCMSPLFSLNIHLFKEPIQSIIFYRSFDVLISESVLCASFSIYDIVGFCSDKKSEEQKGKKNYVSMILSFCTFILYIYSIF